MAKRWSVIIVLAAAALAAAYWAFKPDPEGRAIFIATQYVRNAVGDPKARVWDTTICWADDAHAMAGKVAGLVNPRGTGQRMFVADFDAGVASGEVEIAPLNPQEDEAVYYGIIGVLRRVEANAKCSDWKAKADLAASLYWRARQDGLSPDQATMKALTAQGEAARSAR